MKRRELVFFNNPDYDEFKIIEPTKKYLSIILNPKSPLDLKRAINKNEKK